MLSLNCRRDGDRKIPNGRMSAIDRRPDMLPQDDYSEFAPDLILQE